VVSFTARRGILPQVLLLKFAVYPCPPEGYEEGMHGLFFINLIVKPLCGKLAPTFGVSQSLFKAAPFEAP